MTAFLAIIGGLVPYIPILLDIAGWAIKLFGASDANLQAYQDMIQKNKDAGLITVETYQKLSGWHQDMINAANAKAASLAKLADVHQQALTDLQKNNPSAVQKS